MKTFHGKLNHSLLASLALILASSIANAGTIKNPLANVNIPKGAYFGIFGGWGHSGNNGVTQQGIAFFAPAQGGPLDVNASGHTAGNVWIAGLNAGYLMSKLKCTDIAPGVEIEGYYLRTNQNGSLNNLTPRLVEGHVFKDSFPMRTGVFLLNGIILSDSCCSYVSPYLGLGIGAATISISGADSPQVQPPEPNVNHFNSNPNDHRWAFAAQEKLGFRFDVTCNLKLLAEYRFLYFAPTNYRFGSTQYPNHAPTTKWNVHFGNMIYNMGVVGLEYAV